MASKKPHKAPTHHVEHVFGWKADIYIAPSLLAKLQSRDADIREGARDSVCIRLRTACKHKFPEFDMARVEWGHLKLTPLHTSSTPKSVPLASQPSDNRECDDCPSCDQGYHERCRQAGGCPLAHFWRT